MYYKGCLLARALALVPLPQSHHTPENGKRRQEETPCLQGDLTWFHHLYVWDTLQRKLSKGRKNKNYVHIYINCSFIYDSRELGINKMSNSRSFVK